MRTIRELIKEEKKVYIFLRNKAVAYRFVSDAEREYSAKVEHPDRFELNSATAQNEQSNRQN